MTRMKRDDRLRAVTAKKESEQSDKSEFARKFQGPGGTPGGLGMFIFGLALAIAGGYLIMNQVPGHERFLALVGNEHVWSDAHSAGDRTGPVVL